MKVDFSNPLSALHGDNNPATFILTHHYNAVSLAIEKLVDLYHDDYDISDRDIFNSVLARYGLLKDGFCSEENYIIQEVGRRIRS